MTNSLASTLDLLLREHAHYGPVTALKYLDDAHILIGYGPYLRLIWVKKFRHCEELWCQRVFRKNKIHCISVSSDKSMVAVAGGRSFALLDLVTRRFSEKGINEWIVAIEFSIQSELLILTSHNEVIKVGVSAQGQSLKVQQKIHCNEKSILYSGSIRKCSNGIVYVAAGTVMNGAFIWNLSTREILHNFTDHEGSIFAVEIDSNAKYVISCSDDRSIKLYALSTGTLLATGWGHGSRIWSLLFYDIREGLVTIFSTGEDCSARLWRHEKDDTELKQIECFDNCHEGKHIWSGDAESINWKCIVTGGADGKSRLLDLSENLRYRKLWKSDTVQSQSGIYWEKKEMIKQFVELPHINGFVVMTNVGKLFCYNNVYGWTFIEVSREHSTEFREFGILRGFVSANCVAVCSRLGNILFLTFLKDSAQPIQTTSISVPSIHSIKVINVLSWSDSDRFLLLLVSSTNTSTLLALELVYLNGIVSLKGSYELHNPDSKAFSPTSIYFDVIHRCLLVGSRHGNLAVFHLSQDSTISPYLIRKLCPGDTVTSVSNVSSVLNGLIALITVRDGVYMMVRIRKDSSSFSHEILHQNKFTKGLLEGGLYENGELILYGFRSGSFFIWNETHQLEIDHEACGGAHRQWEFSCEVSKHVYRFNFLRNSTLATKVMHDRSILLSSGTHGREIRDIALCKRVEADGSLLFALASEDTTIKFGHITPNLEISYKWTMNNHVSGLQAVRFMDDEYIASSAANEELIIWKLNREIKDSIILLEHARVQPTEENPDLRVMAIGTIKTDGGFFVAAGFSNSQIKLFYYDKVNKSFSVLAKDTYSTFCILNVDLIAVNEKILLIAGTTDGVVTLWDVSRSICRVNSSISDLGTPIIRQQFHQSGVKAITIIPQEELSWKIITGGDDNSLISADLNCKLGKVSLIIDSFVEKAASATITGIAQAGSHLVIVTSVDQVVRNWDFRDGLVCSAATYTTVADTGCCVCGSFDGENFAIIGGAGLSVFKL